MAPWLRYLVIVLAFLAFAFIQPSTGGAQPPAGLPVPADQRGHPAMERMGTHDAGNIRTLFWNYGMIGDYPPDPLNVDLSMFHSVEAPTGSGMNNSDGITPFVLARITTLDGGTQYIMETGYRERQGISPVTGRVMRFEPRPGYFQTDTQINMHRSPAMSDDPSTWPSFWPDRLGDPGDPGWPGSWNGYFGKGAPADQESFTVMDDQAYDAWDYNPDIRDPTRRGLGLKIEVRSLQWAHLLARDVIFCHYDITNEGTTPYNDNLLFGMYVDPSIGGSFLSCDGIYESDDDNAFWDLSGASSMVYAWDSYGHGVDLSGPCSSTGFLGYSFLETPGNPLDGVDNDGDGIVDERRDGGAGTFVTGQSVILDYLAARYDTTKFTAYYGRLVDRPAFAAGAWWTGDEDMDWDAASDDRGADGEWGTYDAGEGDGRPTTGEPDFDRQDIDEADQLGLAGFKMNRIHPGPGNPDPRVDNIVFYTDANNWPQRLWEHFTAPNPADRFEPVMTSLYNIAFLFASGPFRLGAGETQRFSLALAYAPHFDGLRQKIADAEMLHRAAYGPLRPVTPVPIAMGFDFTPNTLTLVSRGRWVTAFLEPPSPFAASDIDVSSIRLNSTVPVDPAAPTALGDHNGNGIPDLMVKFNRVAVALAVSEGENVPVNVTGTLESQSFQGTDYIRVRRAVVSAPAAGSRLTAGSMTQVGWQTPSGVTIESVALLHSCDGGSTWSLIASGQPNTGSYNWAVPNVQTNQGRVAVVLAKSTVESADLVDGVLGVSEVFAIDALVGVGDGGPAPFALRGVTPNPAQHELRVSFSLRDSKPATLALFDVSGRQLASRRVEGMGAGSHTVTLGGQSNLPAGLYVIRLTQDGRSLTTRAAVVR